MKVPLRHPHVRVASYHIIREPIMNKPLFLFASDPGRSYGTPRLITNHPEGSDWSDKERHLLEDLLRKQYDSLSMKGEGVLTVAGRKVVVKKQPGDMSRQPTLEVWPPETPTVLVPLPIPTSLPAKSDKSHWLESMLSEVEIHSQSEAGKKVRPPEMAMLRLAIQEFRGLANSPNSEPSLLVLAALLSMAQQLSRAKSPGTPQPYEYALSGLQRLMEGEATTPWGAPGDISQVEAPSWFGRFWHSLKGS